MANVINFLVEVENAADTLSVDFGLSDFPQTLVTEKIIFVIDIVSLRNQASGMIKGHDIFTVYKTYLTLKQKICVKPPEFECILYNNSTVLHSNIKDAKDLQAAFKSISNAPCDEDKQPLEIDKVFDKIAALVELPDPECSKKCLPPNWVYHVVWLFGQNLHVPTMQNTNSFDFLMMTPYFALDMLYLYNTESKQCEQIEHALLGLNENGKGYFLSVSAFSKEKLFSSFAQFLGHPLIRVPQEMAMFNIHELGIEVEVIKNNNDEK